MSLNLVLDYGTFLVCPRITQVIFQVTETNLLSGVLVEILSEGDRCLSVCI